MIIEYINNVILRSVFATKDLKIVITEILRPNGQNDGVHLKVHDVYKCVK